MCVSQQTYINVFSPPNKSWPKLPNTKLIQVKIIKRNDRDGKAILRGRMNLYSTAAHLNETHTGQDEKKSQNKKPLHLWSEESGFGDILTIFLSAISNGHTIFHPSIHPSTSNNSRIYNFNHIKVSYVK